MQAPTDSRARSDLRLIKAFVEFLAKLQHEESGEIRRLLKVCSELERIARDVIAKARNMPSTPSRKESKPVVPEFLNGHSNNNNNNNSNNNNDSDRRASASAMLTPESALPPDGSSSLGNLLHTSSTAGMEHDVNVPLSQFTQYFPDMMGRTLNPYPQAQPMYSHGAMFPWDMNGFDASLLPDTFAGECYDFDTNG